MIPELEKVYQDLGGRPKTLDQKLDLLLCLVWKGLVLKKDVPKKRAWPDVSWISWDNWCYQLGITVQVLALLFILAILFS